MTQQPVLRLSVDDPRVQAKFARHAAFWQGADENSFLRTTNVNAASMPVRLPQRDGTVITHAERLEPAMIDPTALIDEVERWDPARLDATLRAQGQYMVGVGVGDLVPGSNPFGKVPWPEAILGCPIKMTEGQIWNEHYHGDPEEVIARAGSFEHNPWFELYFEIARQLQTRLGRRFPPALNSYRGPSDLVAAIVGVQEACIGWLEQPALMARLMRVCTDLLLELIETGNKMAHPVAGGYMGGWGLWAPKLEVGTQSDHSVLLSPRLYKQHILPYDREVLQSCPFSLFHLHSGGLHVAPILCEVPELSVIQVSMDPAPGGERRPQEIEMLHLIQKHKPLMLWASADTIAEGEQFLAQFSRRRLCYVLGLNEETYASLPADFPGREAWILE